MANKYSHRNRAWSVIRGLNEMRLADEMCDVTLKTACGQQFSVHKCVLVAASPYFRDMFMGNFTEAREPRDPVMVQDATALGLEPVLNFLYTGDLNLNNDCVYDVVPIAHMWQISDLVDLCANHLLKSLSVESCFKILRLAKRYDVDKLQKACDKFVLENFVLLSTRQDFLSMSFSEICTYLKKVNGKEVDLYRAATGWLKFEPQRKEDAPKVMSLINFDVIPCQLLTNEVFENELITGSRECLKMLQNSRNFHANLFSQPFEERTCRGEDVLLVYGGGDHMAQLNRSNICTDNDTRAITKNIPCPCDFLPRSVSAIQIGNFAFLFGLHRENLFMGAKRFDASTGHWLTLVAPPCFGVFGSTAVLVNREIIMVAGERAEHRTEQYAKGVSAFRLVDTAVLYSTEKNEWKPIPNCPTKVAYHSACSRNSIFFLAGGYASTQTAVPQVVVSNELYSYDSEAESWLPKAKMNAARAESVFECVGDRLFIVGGFAFKEWVPSVEMYSIKNNQWTTVIDEIPRITRSGPASFVNGELIMFVHGTKVSMYDTKKKKYTDTVAQLDKELRWGVCVPLKM